MGYGSGEYTKSEYARTLAASLAYFLYHAARRGRPADVRRTDHQRFLPPRYRPGHLRRMMAVLQRETAGSSTNLAKPLEADRRIGPQARPGRADFRPAGARRRLASESSATCARADTTWSCCACSTRPKSISRSPRLGMFHDVESGRTIYIDPAAAKAEYQRAISRRTPPKLREACVGLGIDFTQLTTDRPLELALFDLLQARLRRGRRTARRRIAPATEGDRMSLLTPLYVLGLLAVSLPIVVSFDPPHAAGRFRVQLADVPVAVAAAADAAQPARHIFCCCCCAGRVIGIARVCVCPAVLAADEPPLADQRRAAARGDRGRYERQHAPRRSVAAGRRDRRRGDGRSASPYDQLASSRATTRCGRWSGSKTCRSSSRRSGGRSSKNGWPALGPTWAGTHLGRGLLDAVEIVSSVPEPDGQVGAAARRIVLVTDLQQGSRIDERLADYQWPVDVPLDLRTVKSTQPTNAGLHLLADGRRAELPQPAMNCACSVYNDKESAIDQFKLTWLGGEDQPIGAPIDVYVPAGESRVVRVPRPLAKLAARSGSRLSGDDCDFDNTLYFAARPQAEMSVVYLGNDAANDPHGPALLSGARVDERRRSRWHWCHACPDEPLDVGIAGRHAARRRRGRTVGEASWPASTSYIEAGGTVLVGAQRRPAIERGLRKRCWASSESAVEEANVENYTMLGQIAFDHPLFAPMAGPQFNDFTQIYFWKYRRLTGDQLRDANVVARFENGDPAVVERRIGQGQLVVLTSGWQPADSQLARSWKFVLLVSALVDGRRARLSDRTFFVVNEPVPIREREQGGGRTCDHQAGRREGRCLPTDARQLCATRTSPASTRSTASTGRKASP